MYSEFVKDTGCKDNEHNRKVFEGIEKLYMDLNITKEQAYAAGKALVDNSKSPEEIAFEKEITARKAALEADIIGWGVRALDYEKYALQSEEAANKRYWKNEAKEARRQVSAAKAELKELNRWFRFDD